MKRHPGPHGGGDVGGDEAGGSGADDDQVAIEGPGPAPGPIQLPEAPAALEKTHDPGQQAEQGEGSQQGRGEDPPQAGELSQLGAGIHVDHRGRQHAQLGDEGEGQQRHGGEPHQQVHQEEGKHRHQPQAEQVGGTVAAEALLDRRQTIAETAAHQIAEEGAGQQAGRRGTGGGAQRHQHGAPEKPEDGASRQGEHGGAGQGKAGHQHVEDQEGGRGGERGRLPPGHQLVAGSLQHREIELAVPALAEEQHHPRQHQQGGEDPAAGRTARRLAGGWAHGGGSGTQPSSWPHPWITTLPFMGPG